MTLRARDDRCFNDVAAHLALLQYWALGMLAHKGYETLWSPSYLGTLGSIVTPNLALHYDGYPLVEHVAEDSWPTELVMHTVLDPGPNETPDCRLSSIHRLTGAATSAMFVRFYESIVDDVQRSFGNVADWPPTAQFARTVRNAFAHGAVSITDNRPTGNWRGATIDSSLNGRSALHELLGPADVVWLTIDLDLATRDT